MKVAQYASVTPFYVASSNINIGTKDIFDARDAIDDCCNNYGMNADISVECDLTTFFCDHNVSMTRALGLSVTLLILRDISFTNQINHIEENMRGLIIRSLEGDKDTKYINIEQQLRKEILAVNFNQSDIDYPCLPCNKKKGITYGAA